MAHDGYRRQGDRARLRRRALLRSAALGSGITGIVLLACGGDEQSKGASGQPGATGGTVQAAAGAATQAPAAKKGGQLNVAAFVELLGLDPANSTGESSTLRIDSLFEGLLDRQNDLSYAPSLAESYETPDAVTWTFKLRQGVRFHDDTPFNAQAVKAVFDRVMNPDNKLLFRAYLIFLDRVEVVDDRTVRFIHKQPDAQAFENLAAQWMISPKSFVGMDPKQIARTPVATGPFKFKEWAPDTHIKYERFEGYWGGPVNLDGITFKVIKDENARLAAIRARDVEFVQDFSYSVLPVVKGDKDLRIVRTQPLFRTFFIIGKNPKFQDVRVRQAVARFGLPRERIVKEVYGEGAEVAIGAVSSVSKWYIDYRSLVPFDPQKAKQLLAAAGVPNLEFDTIYIPGDQSQVDALLIWQSALKEIGAKMNLVAMDAPAFYAKVQGTVKDYDVGFGASVGPISDLGVLGSTHRTTGAANSSGGGSAEIDDLLARAQATLDFNERKKLYDQAFRLIIEDSKQYYVTFFPAHRVLGKRLQGYDEKVGSRFRFTEAYLQ